MKIDGHMGMDPVEGGALRRPDFRCVVTIVSRADAKKVSNLCADLHIRMPLVFYAKGTATSDVMDILGLGSEDKAIVLCMEHAHRIKRLIGILGRELGLDRKGKGIAFTLPISGLTMPMMELLRDDVRDEIEHSFEKEVKEMEAERKHDLVLAVINQGYSEDVMDAAKAAGATGGTVIHARRVGNAETMNFFGITVQAEKEVVAIVVKREQRRDIMQAISRACGIKTEARGMVLSLPVGEVAGLFEDE